MYYRRILPQTKAEIQNKRRDEKLIGLQASIWSTRNWHDFRKFSVHNFVTVKTEVVVKVLNQASDQTQIAFVNIHNIDLVHRKRQFLR